MKRGLVVLSLGAALFSMAPAQAEQYAETAQLSDKVIDFLCSKESDWTESDSLSRKISRECRDRFQRELLRNPKRMEAAGLMQSELKERPWSDTYWPHSVGSIANPYNDPSTPRIPLRWKYMNRPFLLGREGVRFSADTLSQTKLDDLSPAEKYDFILGDKEFTLTHKIFDWIDHVDSTGDLALWSGICHGWSPASLALARPLHSIQVQGPSGRRVTFFPSDIKALESFLWAKSFANNMTQVEGKQCRKEKGRDWNGRFYNPDCFDVNPAFFHLVLVHQLGIKGKGFIMDRDFEKKVMNQPIYAYSYHYFNPQHPEINRSTLRVLPREFEDARVRLKGYNDPFAEHRSPLAASVVGIEVTVHYADENRPTHRDVDGPKYDTSDYVRFYYDLELDRDDQIVGGEWIYLHTPAQLPREVPSGGGYRPYYYAHPDIIWLVPDALKAWSMGDADASGEWDGRGPVPKSWLPAAIKAANVTDKDRYDLITPRPQPLAKIVDTLIKLSRE